MSLIERNDREAVRALRAEWDHAVPSAGGPNPYASWLEREVVRSRRQASEAVDENERLRKALEFYAEEDSEFDAGGIDGGRRALEALGRSLGGSNG